MLAYLPSYSYSNEVVYGVTQNAANNGLSWVMTNVLPQQAGLTVGNVIYQYTTVKNPEDDMLVHVQNEDAQGPGYIFRETDDWSGIPGNTINKAVSVGGIPISRWGPGSIEVEGEGKVTDPSVIYTYQYDPCFDPQTNPSCPGYKDPFVASLETPEVVDPLDDTFVQDELDRKAVMDEEDQEDRDRKKVASKKKIDERLEKLLGAVNTTVMSVLDQTKHAELMAMQFMPQTYYENIPGGVYEETIVLDGGNLPDNKNSKRNEFAQQILHEKMVNQQYENK